MGKTTFSSIRSVLHGTFLSRDSREKFGLSFYETERMKKRSVDLSDLEF